MAFRPTQRTEFKFNKPNGNAETVVVEVEDNNGNYTWRMIVNGRPSPLTTTWSGILEFKGYFLATDYWRNTFPVMTPFRLELPGEVK